MAHHCSLKAGWESELGASRRPSWLQFLWHRGKAGSNWASQTWTCATS